MNTSQIELLVKRAISSHAHFLGVFARDQVPLTSEHNEFCYIANIEDMTKPGKHWAAFYFTHRGGSLVCEFFDSYAQSPLVYGFVHVPHCINVLSRPVQALNSDACGHHCIYFCVSRSYGYSSAYIRSLYYSRSLRDNDSYVQIYVFRLARRLFCMLSSVCASAQCQCCSLRSIVQQ